LQDGNEDIVGGPPNNSYTGTSRALPLMSSNAFSIAAIARWLTPFGACTWRT